MEQECELDLSPPRLFVVVVVVVVVAMKCKSELYTDAHQVWVVWVGEQGEV